MKGDILLVDLSDSSKGHEQFGCRPAIMLSDTISNMVIVVPITSNI